MQNIVMVPPQKQRNLIIFVKKIILRPPFMGGGKLCCWAGQISTQNYPFWKSEGFLKLKIRHQWKHFKVGFHFLHHLWPFLKIFGIFNVKKLVLSGLLVIYFTSGDRRSLETKNQQADFPTGFMSVHKQLSIGPHAVTWGDLQSDIGLSI